MIEKSKTTYTNTAIERINIFPVISTGKLGLFLNFLTLNVGICKQPYTFMGLEKKKQSLISKVHLTRWSRVSSF